jgi:opacity protein-like surface antigen
MRVARIGALLLGLLASTPAAAVEHEAFQPGAYLGIGAVYAFESFDFDSDRLQLGAILGPGVELDYDDSAGVHLLLGYRSRAWLGIELVYEFLEGFDSTRGTPRTEIDSHMFGLGAKLYPLEGRLQPYLLAGLGAHLINTEVIDPTVNKPFDSDVGFVGRLGAGLAYELSRHWLVELEGSYQLGEGGIVRYARYGTLALHFVYRR